MLELLLKNRAVRRQAAKAKARKRKRNENNGGTLLDSYVWQSILIFFISIFLSYYYIDYVPAQ
jgi:hypothetical protein